MRPTAITPVTETWVRMLPTLSRVANEGLAAAKKLVIDQVGVEFRERALQS